MERGGKLPEASQGHRSQGWEAPPGSAVTFVYQYKTEAAKGGVTHPILRIQPGKAQGLEVRPHLHSQALFPGEQKPEQEQSLEILEILALTLPN